MALKNLICLVESSNQQISQNIGVIIAKSGVGKTTSKVIESFKLLKQDILERRIDIEVLEVMINDINSTLYARR